MRPYDSVVGQSTEVASGVVRSRRLAPTARRFAIVSVLIVGLGSGLSGCGDPVAGDAANVSTTGPAVVESSSVGSSSVGSSTSGSSILDSAPVAERGPTLPSSGPGPTIPKGRGDQEIAAQAAADAAMVWVGEAYRELSRAGEVTDAGLRGLNAGYTGRAYLAERDVYREYGKNPSALAATPDNPILYIGRVRQSRPTCFVVQAEFDESPLLAFPTGEEQKVIAVLRLEDGFWRIATLTRSDTGDSRDIDCETT
jgi:hypothetical protein